MLKRKGEELKLLDKNNRKGFRSPGKVVEDYPSQDDVGDYLLLKKVLQPAPLRRRGRPLSLRSDKTALPEPHRSRGSPSYTLTVNNIPRFPGKHRGRPRKAPAKTVDTEVLLLYHLHSQDVEVSLVLRKSV